MGRETTPNWDADEAAISHCAEPHCRAIAREKVHSRNLHPDVIAKLEAKNEGNKRKFIPLSEKKDDLLCTRQKSQRNIGRCKVMKYFDENKDKKMTWSAMLFDDENGLTGGGKVDATDDSCHCEKYLL